MSDFIWVEKYRPKTIEDCILPEATKKTFQEFLNKGEIPNMLLAGPPGIGKTTVAKALCNELGADVYVINGSDEGRFLDTVRNNAKNFASTVYFRQLLNTKSSSLMRQITRPMMFNSAYGRLLRSLLVIADSSSPVTTKIRSLLPSIPDVQSLTFPSKEKSVSPLPHNSSSVSKKSWLQKVLNLITRSWQNLLISTSLIGVVFLMSVSVTLSVERLMLVFLLLSPMLL